MPNLRDIINAATPGPWELVDKGKCIGTPEEDVCYVSYRHNSNSDNDRDYIAAYSPDHTLLIEAVIASHRITDPASMTLMALDSYRKAHGYE